MKPRKRNNPDGKKTGDKAFLKIDGLEFGRQLLNHPDIKEAKALVADQAGLRFDQVNGYEKERLKLIYDELVDLFKRSKKEFLKLLDKMNSTPRRIKVSSLNGDGGKGGIPFLKWEGKDQAIYVSSIGTMFIVLGAGCANIYANLMSAGIPIFLENESLAYFLCVLLPTGSFAIKFLVDYLENDRTRKRFTLGLYIIAALTLLAWVVLFSINFHGVSGGMFDLESFAEPGSSNNTDAWFVGVQLVGEMVVGALLFISASDIHSRYSPGSFIENSEFAQAEIAYKSKSEEHAKLQEQLAECKGELAELESARKAYINEQVVQYLSQRGRWDASNSN